MPTWHKKEFYARDKDLVVDTLASALSTGELSLLLGAGVSSKLGLPSWPQLVNRCSEETKNLYADFICEPPFAADAKPTGDEMFRRMERVRKKIGDDRRYLAIVQGCLYLGCDATALTTRPTETLRAIGAMIMGSRRGKVSDVLTLNFDCALESYLALHGFVIQVVERWPSILTDADVRVYHPHGYMPIDAELGEGSGDIVFDSLAVDRRLVGNLWNEIFRNVLVSRVILAVGLSGADYLLRTLVTGANDQLLKPRPIGFWLCLPDVDNTTREMLETRGFVTVPMKDGDEVAQFLFSICRVARRRMLTFADDVNTV